MHLLIGSQTPSGKSILINILLYTQTGSLVIMPDDLLRDDSQAGSGHTDRVSESAALTQLRAFIADRAFQPGGRLPAERVLCSEPGLRRSEVRRALETLESANVLWRHVGKGTFLTSNTDRTIKSDFGRLAQQVSPADVMRARSALEPALARQGGSGCQRIGDLTAEAEHRTRPTGCNVARV